MSKKPCIQRPIRLYLGTNYHVRFLPVRNSFEVDALYFGISLESLDGSSSLGINRLFFGYNRRGIFSLWDEDYLGVLEINGRQASIKEKLWYQLEHKGFSTTGIDHVELITQPRFLGYAFNFFNFYFCYSIGKLRCILVEGTNAGGDKWVQILSRNEELDCKRKGYKMTFSVPRTFHISPFNSSTGSYEVHVNDPLDGSIDVRFVIWVDPLHDKSLETPPSPGLLVSGVGHARKKKFLAKVSAAEIEYTWKNVIVVFLKAPGRIWLSFPKFTLQCIKLACQKSLKVYQAPDPPGYPISRAKAGFFERYAMKVFLEYLKQLSIIGKIHLRLRFSHGINRDVVEFNGNTDTNKLGIATNVVLTVKSYQFFTYFLMIQDPVRGLLVTYSEGLWDATNLSGFLRVVVESVRHESNRKQQLTTRISAGLRRFLSLFVESNINLSWFDHEISRFGLRLKKDGEKVLIIEKPNTRSRRRFRRASLGRDGLTRVSSTSLTVKLLNQLPKFDHIIIPSYETGLSKKIEEALQERARNLHILSIPTRPNATKWAAHPIEVLNEPSCLHLIYLGVYTVVLIIYQILVTYGIATFADPKYLKFSVFWDRLREILSTSNQSMSHWDIHKQGSTCLLSADCSRSLESDEAKLLLNSNELRIWRFLNYLNKALLSLE
ncbi:hypothetical protein K7432_007381 [Basidiobolus ranarum]|uniref:Uncharacterized protein n=1 Tax=Basidiobolus ranarum TaxID=34480 RepID=A0ABR2WTG1_9FUNG